MFICSVRAASVKFVGAVVLSVAALVALVAFVPESGAKSTQTVAGAAGSEFVYSGIKSNEDRVKFLSQFGYEVESEPKEEEEIKIPGDFDKVYMGYNEIQKNQGLDLSDYKNKKVTRYTYKVTNYDGYDGEVLANLIIWRDHVIAGDICSADTGANGFVHGFRK